MLKDYRIIEGKAIDVLTTTEKRGYLMIDNGREQQQIESNQLSKMQVLTPNAKFKEVAFRLMRIPNCESLTPTVTDLATVGILYLLFR